MFLDIAPKYDKQGVGLTVEPQQCTFYVIFALKSISHSCNLKGSFTHIH